MQAGKAVAMVAPPGFLAFHRGAEASPEGCGLLLMLSMTRRSMRLACRAVSGLQLHEVCARPAERAVERRRHCTRLEPLASGRGVLLSPSILVSRPPIHCIPDSPVGCRQRVCAAGQPSEGEASGRCQAEHGRQHRRHRSRLRHRGAALPLLLFRFVSLLPAGPVQRPAPYSREGIPEGMQGATLNPKP